MSNAFDRVFDSLVTSGSTTKDVRQGHFLAQCPAHEDKNPSLGVDDKGDKVMVRCYAGCHPDDVLAAIGLSLSDLFDDTDLPSRGEFGKGHLVRSYVYETVAGEPWIIKDRWFPKFFTQRLPGTEPGDRAGLKGRPPILYRAPKLHRAMKAGGARIYLVDGEKDVESIERAGGMATCPPGGAGARWQEKFSEFLRDAAEVYIVTDQDPIKPNGTLGAGQQFAAAARMGLRSVGVKVKVVAPAAGKDATDHLAAGFALDEFVNEPTVYTRPRGMDACALMHREFEPINFAVDKILPSGLTILAGSPKAGKSWCCLDLCLAVAAGGPALSGLGTMQGNALYLAREDTYRRLQARVGLIMGGSMDAPKQLELVPQEHDWPGGEQGIANLEEWAEEVESPRLVVIDTIAKVEPDMGEGRGGAYTGNYSMMASYKNWADRHNISLVMIHHDRKQAPSTKSDIEAGLASDPFSRISGTRGLTGAADTLWFLESVRGSQEGALHITGRDVVEQTVDLRKAGPLWIAMSLPD